MFVIDHPANLVALTPLFGAESERPLVQHHIRSLITSTDVKLR